MKNIIVFILISFLSVNSFAQYKEVDPNQDKEEPGGFQKEKLFSGGGLQLSYSNYNFVVGASPVLGYSFNKWFDAAIGINFIYNSSRVLYYINPYDPYSDFYVSDDKARATLIGPLAFVKFYPVKFIFIQAQGEMNFISVKNIFADGAPTEKAHYSAPSLLLGAGYCIGRENSGEMFYYISVAVDVLKNRNSPYVQQTITGNYVMQPVIRAGIQIPLFQGKR